MQERGEDDTLASPGSAAPVTDPAAATRQSGSMDRAVAAAMDRTGEEPAWIGRFVVFETLGAGGMGEVFAAYDPELDRKVALKLVQRPPEGAGVGDWQARLIREAQAMAKLSHPNVVTVYEVGAHAGQVFLAMELVQGRDLARWLVTPRSWGHILEVFRAAGEGLAAAHRAGLVHRDFKPKSDCPPQTAPLPPSGRILADRGDLRGAVCRVMPRHAASCRSFGNRVATAGAMTNLRSRPSTVVAACRCMPSAEMVSGGGAAGAGGGTRCGQAHETRPRSSRRSPREDAGEELCPADAARSGGGLGGGRRVVILVEVQGELLAEAATTDGGRMRGWRCAPPGWTRRRGSRRRARSQCAYDTLGVRETWSCRT